MAKKIIAQETTQETTQDAQKLVATAPTQDTQKPEVQDTAITTAVSSLEGFGFLVDADKPLTMAGVDGKPATTITLTDKSMQVSATVVQTALKAGNALDYIVCVQMAKLKRNSAHSDAHYDSFGKFGEALTAWNKDTVNAYTSVGETYFTEAGQPVKPYVKELSVSALNQLKGLVNAKLYVYKGVAVNHDFLQAVFEHFNYNITVGKIKDMVKILKSGVVPDEWITINADGTATLLCSDIVLNGYSKEQAQKPEQKPEQKQEKGDKGEKSDKGEKKVVDPLELMSDALVAMQKLTLETEFAKRFEVAQSAMRQLIIDIENANKAKKQESEQETAQE